ncbi:hypothetical protein KA005_52375, partial [bacterium]|nr:hypothetical protein [bacterium]
MYPVFVIDIVSFLASLTAMIVLLKGWSRALQRDTKLLITGLLTLALFHHFSNVLEWSGITNALDVYEDYIEILTPIWWGFIFYTFLQEIAARDLHQSEERYRSLVENIEFGVTMIDS